MPVPPQSRNPKHCFLHVQELLTRGQGRCNFPQQESACLDVFWSDFRASGGVSVYLSSTLRHWELRVLLETQSWVASMGSEQACRLQSRVSISAASSLQPPGMANTRQVLDEAIYFTEL